MFFDSIYGLVNKMNFLGEIFELWDKKRIYVCFRVWNKNYYISFGLVKEIVLDF